jgi:hypothetical protein
MAQKFTDNYKIKFPHAIMSVDYTTIGQALEDDYADRMAREIQRELDYTILKELMLKIGAVTVLARPGVDYADVEKWCAITGVKMPISNGDEYVFVQHEDATAFVLRFG